MSRPGKLYLIPTVLGDTRAERVIPDEVLHVTRKLVHFIAENEKTARRYLKSASTEIPLNDLVFGELNKRTNDKDIPDLIAPLLNGFDVGLISEAGLAGIADPGAKVVALCHLKNIQVVPLTGPSSVILALIGSGFNGQNFTFHGYLPIDGAERRKVLKNLERQVSETGYTQIFMETPFRNEKLLDDILKNCRPDTKLSIARSITTPDELISTRTVRQWKKNRPDLHKKPCIFSFGS